MFLYQNCSLHSDNNEINKYNECGSYHADEVDPQENLPSRLQGSAAGFLSVHLPRPAGQNHEASDDGQRSGVHPNLPGNNTLAEMTT